MAWYSINGGCFYLFCLLYFWLCWVFIAARGLPLVAASGGYSSLWCADFLLWLLLLQSTGSRCAGFSSCGTWAQLSWHVGSVVVAHRLSCSTACGIFPDQRSNPCPLHWQADSYPLCHQGSPAAFIKTIIIVNSEAPASQLFPTVFTSSIGLPFFISPEILSRMLVCISQVSNLKSNHIVCVGLHTWAHASHHPKKAEGSPPSQAPLTTHPLLYISLTVPQLLDTESIFIFSS